MILRIVPAAGPLPAHVLSLAPLPAPVVVELCDCGGCEDCHARRRRAIERQSARGPKGAAMNLSVYVAGASADRTLVAGFIRDLRRAGWTVTYDWTTDPGWTDPLYPRAVSAESDLEGVIAARVFWYVAPEAKSEGSHFELGVAVAERRRDRRARAILTSGPFDLHARIFPTLGNRHFVEHEQALAWLVALAHEQRAADASEPDHG